jgi:HEAT repeat protein
MESGPSSEIADLFARATIRLDDDDDEQWSSENRTGRGAIGRLHRLATREALDTALAVCAAADPLQRRIAAAVLGQLGHSKMVFQEERYAGLAGLLAAERAGPGDPDVLNEVCVALGHLRDPRAIPALLELRGHPDSDVRFGVVIGLSGHEDSDAIDGLIALSSDHDEDVREWATFGIGAMITIDTPAIRAALHARLDDPHYKARNDAIEGLAARGDLSVLPILIRELKTGVALPLLDAAIALRRPELCEALAVAERDGLAIQALYGPYDLRSVWRKAMHACRCQLAESVLPAGEQQQIEH